MDSTGFVVESEITVSSDAAPALRPRRFEPLPPCPPREEPLILDIAHLRTFSGGNIAFEREIYGLFFGELPNTVAALETAKTARDWHMAAHTLKGSALGVGAFQLARCARLAEQLLTPSHPSRPSALLAIRAAVDDVRLEARRLEMI